MKKYAFIALPVLAILFALLIWLLQPVSETKPAEEIPIPDVAPAASIEPTELGIKQAPEVSIVEPEIADIEEITTTVLQNTQLEESLEGQPATNTDTSDSALKSYTSKNLNPKINDWLVKDHVLNKAVRALNALEEGKLVSKYRPLLMPKQSFSTQKQGGKWFIPQSNYDRYTPYITTLESIGDTALLNAFNHYYPALSDSYKQLGVDKGAFRQVTRRALQQLLDAPDFSMSPELSRESVVFKFKDPKLEKLPEAQKLMIRMGPENSLRLKALIKKILSKMQ